MMQASLRLARFRAVDRIHASLTPQNSDILTLLSASKCHSLDYVTIDGVSKGDTIPPSVVWKMTIRVPRGWTTDDERARSDATTEMTVTKMA